MQHPHYIYGFKKRVYDVRIMLRLLSALFKDRGLIKTLRDLKSYLKHPQQLFRQLPNRYVRIAEQIYVVPDVPPMNTKAFIDYLIRDIDVQAGKKRLPLLFGIVCISSVCPYKCPYCYNLESHDSQQRLSPDAIVNAIEGLLGAGVKNIYLSGGEPLMRTELVFKLLETYGNRGLGFWLITTGFGLDDALAKRLKSSGLRGVMVSLDTYEAANVDKVKGKGAFDKGIRAMQACSAAGLVVVADCVMSHAFLNGVTFKRYAVFAGAQGVSFINMYIPRAMGNRGIAQEQTFSIEDMMLTGIIARINQTDKEYRTLPLSYSPDAFEAGRGCMGGRLFVYIDPEGRVKRCPFRKEVVGDITNERMEDVLLRLEEAKQWPVCKVNEVLRRSILFKEN